MGDRRVVFFAHAADRTGPPMYLLQLLRALALDDLEVVVVLLSGGELLGQLQALAEVRVVGEPVGPNASPGRLAEEPRRLEARRAQLADLRHVPLAVINTAWSAHALAWLPTAPQETVAIVHELSAGVGDLLDESTLATLLASDRFVVGCRAVAAMLIDDLGIDAHLVDLIPYGVTVDPDATPADRSMLDADAGSFLVLAAGVPDRRKGPDLFVHLAASARLRRPDIDWSFRWIGANEDDPRLADALADRALLDADRLVRFLPPTAELRSWLAAGDAFVLPSRQDAFPLAAIEAALARLPLLCFASGGIGELVEPDAGALVPYPDLEAMVDHLERWHDDASARLAAGTAAHERARRRHDVEDHARAFDALVLHRR